MKPLRQYPEAGPNLEQARKLEIIGTLASVIAHDLNNQLTVIMGNGALALEMLGSEHPASEGLSEAQQAAERCVEMTRGLLNLSHGVRPELKPVALEHVLTATQRMLRRVLPCSVTLRCLQGSELPGVLADTMQLQQVILNLAVNAVNVLPGECVLVVEPRNSQRHVTISICSARHGADPKPGLMERLLPEKPQEAYGIGLIRDVEIMSAHGGWIDVARDETGIMFRVSLPVPDRPDSATTGEGCACILIAEDEALVRRAAVQMLLRKGYNVMEARNGEEAVRIFSENAGRIDLVFLDVTMPGLTGLEALERIRSLRGDVKALLASGYPIEAKADFLAKPYTPRQLARKLEEILAE